MGLVREEPPIQIIGICARPIRRWREAIIYWIMADAGFRAGLAARGDVPGGHVTGFRAGLAGVEVRLG